MLEFGGNCVSSDDVFLSKDFPTSNSLGVIVWISVELGLKVISVEFSNASTFTIDVANSS
jgi:hypothetical protein